LFAAPLIGCPLTVLRNATACPPEFRKKGKGDQVCLMGDLSAAAEIPGAVPLDAGRQDV
jgi:hypothetical protein